MTYGCGAYTCVSCYPYTYACECGYRYPDPIPNGGDIPECDHDIAMKPASIDELVTVIYEDNRDHFDFMENMNGGDCDCNLHATMNMIMRYTGVECLP
jgi:hypothetical protein